MNTHDKYELPPLFLPGAIGKYTKKEMQNYAREAIEHFLNQSGQYMTNDASRQAAIDAAIEADRQQRYKPALNQDWMFDAAPQPAEPSDPAKDAVEEDNRRAAEQACNVLALRLGYVWNGEDWIEHKPAEPNEWKQAVDYELTSIHSTADSFPSAKEAVKALVDWHVAVATDPVFHPAEPVKEVSYSIDAKALATAQEIALMWGHDRSQFVSRIQVAVLDAMRWAQPVDPLQKAQNECRKDAESAEPVKVPSDVDVAKLADRWGVSSDGRGIKAHANIMGFVHDVLARYTNKENKNG